MIDFRAFPKIPRLNRPVVITEKIDGTNGVIHVAEDGTVTAGSRTRWITPEDDNFGFAAWVSDNAEELAEGLGHGFHYGEWWGSGIQRKYGLTDGERRFSLFNTGRWRDEYGEYIGPGCCTAVPVIGVFDHPTDDAVAGALGCLRRSGSYAAPGFNSPEGIVIYHTASHQSFKVLLEGDEIPKSAVLG